MESALTLFLLKQSWKRLKYFIFHAVAKLGTIEYSTTAGFLNAINLLLPNVVGLYTSGKHAPTVLMNFS